MEKLEFKGTKGNWQFLHTSQHPTEENEWHSAVQMPNIAISIVNTKFLSKYESESNAKLIASAPNLLEALQEMVNLWTNLSNFLPTIANEEGFIKAKQAIEKALK